jgi:hypothetical protein
MIGDCAATFTLLRRECGADFSKMPGTRLGLAALRVFLAVSDEDDVAVRGLPPVEADGSPGAAVLGQVQIAALDPSSSRSRARPATLPERPKLWLSAPLETTSVPYGENCTRSLREAPLTLL